MINGTVTGDALLAGASIAMNGQVEGDMRAAGADITIAGTIGEDLIAGGGGGTIIPFAAGEQPLTPGIHLAKSARVGGDAVLGGGAGSVGGTIVGNLWLGMGTATLAATVGGNADVASNSIRVADTAHISSALRYTSTTPNPTLESERGHGVLLLALLGRLPVVGWLVSLVSFVLALGALIVARRVGGAGRPAAQALAPPALAPAP